MDIITLLHDDNLSDLEKRTQIAEALKVAPEMVKDIVCDDKISENSLEILLEAIEHITGESAEYSNEIYLKLADKLLTHNSDSVKREALRIVGNLAYKFADKLGDSVPKIIADVVDGGVIVRWSGAYALSKIISTPQYAFTFVHELVEEFSEREKNNGIKALYLKGLEEAKQLRL